jgi:hypothetical protein
MPANAAGRGSFGNLAGGGRRWVEFRIVLESAGLFHGDVINAGSNCLRIHFICAVMLSEAKHLWSIPLSGIGRKIDPRFFVFAQNDNLVCLLAQ